MRTGESEFSIVPASFISVRHSSGGGIAVHEATVAQVEVPSSKTAVVLQDHEEYRVVCGSGSGGRLCRLRSSVRLALLLLSVLSGIVGGFPGGRAAENLNGPLVLLGGDLASGEALPEDLLRRVPGRLQSLVPANLGEDAHYQPRYHGHEPTQKRNKE